LAQISKVLTQITTGREFGDDNPSYIPLEQYIHVAIAQLTAWMLEGNSHTKINGS
jgi:Ras GTPase-activating-like protein IQGAP2/3